MKLGEIHLFILWHRASHARDALIRRIGNVFNNLRVFRIHWNPACFAENLTRFYGQHLPTGCAKEQECGTGPFFLVVVRDERPEYAERPTTRGRALVNARVFDLKSEFRSSSWGHLPVHATNTAREARHDLALLLGVDIARFETLFPGTWNGEVLERRSDLAGSEGWKDFRELFAILDAAVNYVVLRNFESLPDHHDCTLHGDIDLLVDDLVDAVLVSNAVPCCEDPRRVHYHVRVAGQNVPFDFRYVGDDYYDRRWEMAILANRRLSSGGIYVPSAEHHFYSLLYHAAVHKERVAPDYVERLAYLAAKIGFVLPDNGFFDDRKQLRRVLTDYLSHSGYRFTRPIDPSVLFNADIGKNLLQSALTFISPERKPSPPPSVPRLNHVATTFCYTPSIRAANRTIGLVDDITVQDLDKVPFDDQGCQPRSSVAAFLASNPLGLSQFNGFVRAPFARPYAELYGIGSQFPSWTELNKQLDNTGWRVCQRYFAFPDHRNIKLLVSEMALKEKSFDIANLLALMSSHGSSSSTHPAFHEPLAWRGLIANGLLPDLANSFFVIAGRDEKTALACLDPTFLAATYTADRLPPYATETVFRKASNAIHVEKKRLFPEKSYVSAASLGEGELLHRVDTVTEYIPGELHIVDLQRRLARGDGVVSVTEWAVPWLRLLREVADTEDRLPGEWLDAIPQNFIRTEDETLHRIDEEWALSCPVPLSWVVIRGLVNAFGVCPTSPALASLSLQETIHAVAASAGIQLVEADFRLACERETQLRHLVYGQESFDLIKWLTQPPRCTLGPPTQSEWAAAEIARLSAEIARIKSTVSWQLTKPLRALWNIPQRLVTRLLS